MNTNEILNLLNANQLPPAQQGIIAELIESLIESPSSRNKEALLFALGANKLDLATQQTISENLDLVIDQAAETILDSVGKEKRKINKLYLKNEKEMPVSFGLLETDKVSNLKQVPKKSDFKWDRGRGSDFMKKSKPEKVKVSDYKWEKTGLSPLSGKVYKTGAGK
jgi:hypothetical protein